MKKLVLSCLISGMLLTTAGLQAQTGSPTTADKAAQAKADKAKAKADKAAARAQAKADKEKAKADKAAADAKTTTATATTPATKPATNPVTQPATPRTTPATTAVTQGVNKSADKAVGTDAKGRTIYEGPRGGRYVLSKNGNKEYIKKGN